MILFLNHFQPRCGVYQMGHRIGTSLSKKILDFKLYEGDFAGALQLARQTTPKIVIHNWHPYTLPWSKEFTELLPGAKHVGLIHEIATSSAHAGSDLFKYRMVCDPTFPVDDRTIFRSVRHVPRYSRSSPVNDRFTVGSFGFAVGGKLYHNLVPLICDSFPRPRIRLHIPRAFYGDDVGNAATGYAQECAKRLRNNATLEISHEFLEEDNLLDWLAQNDLNAFFYEPNIGRGAASAIDYAIAVKRPIALNGSEMFRHVLNRLGCYPNQSLPHLYFSTQTAVNELYEEWGEEKLAADYWHMISCLTRI